MSETTAPAPKPAVPALAALAVGGCVCLIAHAIAAQRAETPRVRARNAVLTVWAVAALLWPPLWYATMGPDNVRAWTLPSLAWPLLIISLDVASMRYTAYETQVASKRTLLSMDANAMCSLTFAISTVLSAQRYKCCQHIFLAAVVACIAFVIPAPYAATSAIEHVVVEATQKAILAYATGLVLGGILSVYALDIPA